MKEVEWRGKLVRAFKKENPDKFIWAMDAKFKSGFPDLYIIDGGHTQSSTHIELKICDKPKGLSIANCIDMLSPIQLSVINSITKAGGVAYEAVLNKAGRTVYLIDVKKRELKLFHESQFMKWFTKSNHTWYSTDSYLF